MPKNGLRDHGLHPKQGKLRTVLLMDRAGRNAEAVQNEIDDLNIMKSDGVCTGVLESAVEMVKELNSVFIPGYAHHAISVCNLLQTVGFDGTQYCYSFERIDKMSSLSTPLS